MDSHSLFAFTLVAAIAIASPGPATLVALHNSVAYGAKSTLWSSLGNISGLFCMSAAAMLGLGALIVALQLPLTALADEAENPRQRELVAHLKSEVNAGRSFGVRLVTRPLSTMTSSSLRTGMARTLYFLRMSMRIS